MRIRAALPLAVALALPMATPALGQKGSDTAPLHDLASTLRELGEDLRWMRDPTRGGLARRTTKHSNLVHSAHPNRHGQGGPS